MAKILSALGVGAALLLSAAETSTATDISLYSVFKGQVFTEDISGESAPATNRPFVFQAVVSPFYYPINLSPVLVTPAATSDPLAAQFDPIAQETDFVFTDHAASLEALDAVYGAGDYTCNYDGPSDGPTSVPITLGSDAFPPVPAISNLLAAQSIDATRPFTLHFSAWSPADSNAFTQLIISDGSGTLVFASAPIYNYDPAPLTSTNSLVVITNGVLASGRTYNGRLIFTRLSVNTIDSFSFPTLLGGFFSETDFPLQTMTANINTNVPPQDSPDTFTSSALTLTVTNSTGSLSPSGTSEIFTSLLGTNYSAFGPATVIGGGGYQYLKTGTNTANLAFTDSKGGIATLQITFEQGAAGSFVLTTSAGTQSGRFTALCGFAALSVPRLFLPGFTNRQFQTYLSGDRGVAYHIDSSPDLVHWSPLTNLTVSNGAIPILDSAAAPGRFYRAHLASAGFAPADLLGKDLNCTVTGGALRSATNGDFQWAADTNSLTFQLLDPAAGLTAAGSYSYNVTDPNLATLSYQDAATGDSYTNHLVFASPTSGYFFTGSSNSSAFQYGQFNLTPHPSVFLGNVRFTPDLQRGAGAEFSADGTPLSISVTDAASNVWTLNLPGDALLSPRTITMVPFAAIDARGSALPIRAGVQLGPEGTQFSDAVTLTLTPPSPLGAHAAILMSAGDGSSLQFVTMTNSATNYSVSLLHFSSAAAADPDDQQWQDFVDHNFPLIKAAYEQDRKEVQDFIDSSVIPADPPDYELKCAGNPQADQAQEAWQTNLFAPERDAIAKLLGDAKLLILITGDQQWGTDAGSMVKELLESDGYRQIDFLFDAWQNNPLKARPVIAAALSMSRDDSLLGGSGRPDWLATILDWLKGNVNDYYWNKLRQEHDYSMSFILPGIHRQITLLAGQDLDPDFLVRLAKAYTFKVTLSVSDVGTDNFDIEAGGEITISQDPDFRGPIAGTNHVDYSAGIYSDLGHAFNYTLEMPLSFSEGVALTLEPCTNLLAHVYIQSMGAVETWDFPGGSESEGFLGGDFGQAFVVESAIPTASTYFGLWEFDTEIRNNDPEIVKFQRVGPGVETLYHDTVTFKVSIQHTPK